MSDQQELLLGQIAINQRCITREQLDFCLNMQESGLTELPLGELLFEQGFLTREQLDNVLASHSEELEKPSEESSGDTKSRRGDILFGRMVVAMGLATAEEVNSCLRAQEQSQQRGEFINLGELMVRKSYLTEEQVKEVLARQKKTIMECASCSAKFNVPAYLADDNFTCVKCGTILTRPGKMHSLRVEASLSQAGDADTLIGRELGGCRLLELIGKGNYGRVYKAKHVGLNKFVCVKVLPVRGQTDDMIKRFILEARAAAKLEHPNIVQVYNVGQEGDYCFIVMQYIEGRSLESLINDGAGFHLDDALMIIREVTRGLIMAHNTGIVHRDLKPDNILIANSGQIRITDFGLAQDVEYAGVVPSEGLVIGTPYYMSPEAWRGSSPDGRSDIYSLGVILYYMVTSRRPFEALRVTELRKKHLEQDPLAVHKVKPELPSVLSTVINKLLDKDPDKRFQTGEEFLEALDAVDRKPEAPTIDATGIPSSANFPTVSGDAEEESLEEDQFYCPNCHTINKEGDESCEGCELDFCQVCKSEIAMVKGRCPECIATGRQPEPEPTTPKRSSRRRRPANKIDRRRRRRRR